MTESAATKAPPPQEPLLAKSTPPKPRPPTTSTPPPRDPQAAPVSAPASEWDPVMPTEKRMGLIRLTLDRGVKTTAIGQLYGLDFELESDDYTCRVFFDYYNRRLKVLDFDAGDVQPMLDRLRWLAEQNDFDKIFLKATQRDWQSFLPHGYLLEGILRYYFRGEDAYVLSKFRSVDRVTSAHLIEESDLIEKLMREAPPGPAAPLEKGYQLVRATPAHIPALVELYRDVFKTYPSPLTHPDYILATMERNVLYRAVVDEDGHLVSAASAEIDEKHSNAELTDCATSPRARGKGLMFHIVHALEHDLRAHGIMTAYSLARARSVGMNRVFYRLGHEFSGRLVNNCDIYGQFEDMNIWVKRLDQTDDAR